MLLVVLVLCLFQILRIGFYEIVKLHMPPYAVVDESLSVLFFFFGKISPCAYHHAEIMKKWEFGVVAWRN